MIILVSGGCKSGKSTLAQKLACQLSASGRRYYLATMCPSDGEDRERIRRHVQERAGLGFETVEQGSRILDCLDRLEPYSTVLLDSLTALLANEMFGGGPADRNAAERLAGELEAFALHFKAGNVIAVSDCIASDARQYEALTELYRSSLAFCEQRLAALADIVAELCAGRVYIHKGRALWQSLQVSREEEKAVELIIGGAYQGKLSYVKKHFCLREDEISVCTRDGEADLSRRCIAHLENYVYFCLKQGRNLQQEFSPNTILVCDDISCGVVPMDAFERAWREATGRYLQQLARFARVTRIFCGLAQQL